MTGNQTLAGYDMVLGLSEATINYQFKQLHKRKIIHQKWGVLVSMGNSKKNETPYFINSEDKNFRSKLDRWIELQQEIEEDEDYELIVDVKTEKVNFDYGWDCQINPPKIVIKDKNTQNVILLISFKSGTLFYRPDKISSVLEYKLDGLTYAFVVPVGKLKITKDKMVMDAQDHVEQVIRRSGLSDQDFTIESLFLNFSNANIASFDKDLSNLPADLALPLQVSMQNFFNTTISESNNPYILGYGVTRRKISSSEKAMFQPTHAAFSTSYSSKRNTKNPVAGQYSSFNFLMMVNNRAPVYDQNTGVLPGSLIELGQDQSSTTDGVFAIRDAHFEKYLQNIDSYVASIFESQEGVTVRDNGFYNTPDGRRVMYADHHAKRIDDTIDTQYALRRKEIQKITGGIRVEYGFQVEIDVKVNAKTFIAEWTVKEIKLSTEGQYTHGDIKEKGAQGVLRFDIKAGAEGKFTLDYKMTPPKIAFNVDPNIIKGNFFEIIGGILQVIFLWPIKLVEGIINQIAVDLGTANVSSQNEKIEKLRSIDVLNQTNKVILPLGKVYTYKNLRHIEDKGIVAYDISYAPVVG